MKWPSASFSSTWRCFIPMSSHNALRVKKSRRNCVLKSSVFFIFQTVTFWFSLKRRFVSFLVWFVLFVRCTFLENVKMIFFLLTIKKFCQLPKSEEWKASNVYYNEASTTTEIKPLLTVLKSQINHLIQYTQGKSAVFCTSAKAFDSRLVD